MTAKSILLRIELEGNGIVNFDSKDQKFLWNKLSREKWNHDNINFAKKVWEYNEDGKLTYKVKISSDSLRHAIFGDNIPCQTPNVSDNQIVYLTYLASPSAICRGYMNTDKDYQYKKKSALSLTSAVQTNNTLSSIEVGTTSGVKNTDENKSDNTLHYHETIGDITYLATGVIDLMQLQFVSMDEIFDRLALNSDYFNVYKTALKYKMSTFNSEPKYYHYKSSDIEIPELGFVFSNDDMNFLVKYLLKSILKTNIKKRNAYANVSKVQIKIVEDCTIDTKNSNDGWIDLTNDVIDNLNLDVEVFFEEENNIEKVKELRFEFEEADRIRKEESKKKKEDAKKKKEEAKI